jgi:hypothetical protein
MDIKNSFILKEEIKNNLINTIKTNSEIKRNTIFEAEEISFMNFPSEKIDFDDFGFLLKYEQKKYNNNNNEKEEKSNERLIKWTKMLENFEEFKRNNYSKLKNRVRKGIPDCMRSSAWPILANINKIRKKGVYENLIQSLKEEKNLEDEEIIIRDLHRTFPKHYLFMEKLGEGQRALYRVLTCYSKFNKKTGYVQGMGFCSALFLTYLNEECSFWMLHSLMINYGMEGFFLKGFPELRITLYVFLSLLKKILPKCFNLLKKFQVYPTMFASQWFITFYSCVFDFNILVRIFDCIFLEGFKIIYRIALAIFKINQEELLKKQSFENIMDFLKSITKNIDENELMRECFKFSFSRKDIKKYEQLYKKNIDSLEFKKDEIMKLVNF